MKNFKIEREEAEFMVKGLTALLVNLNTSDCEIEQEDIPKINEMIDRLQFMFPGIMQDIYGDYVEVI